MTPPDGATFDDLQPQQAQAPLTPYDEHFDGAGQTYGIDPNLLRSFGYNESRFNPRAVSSANAQGLMQIIPSTQRMIGVSDPFDAKQSIYGGARYLRHLYDTYQDPTLATAAYNAGPGRVDEWLQRYGDPRAGQISTDDWVNRIPIAETRNYVGRVANAYQAYRSGQPPGDAAAPAVDPAIEIARRSSGLTPIAYHPQRGKGAPAPDDGLTPATEGRPNQHPENLPRARAETLPPDDPFADLKPAAAADVPAQQPGAAFDKHDPFADLAPPAATMKGADLVGEAAGPGLFPGVKPDAQTLLGSAAGRTIPPELVTPGGPGQPAGLVDLFNRALIRGAIQSGTDIAHAPTAFRDREPDPKDPGDVVQAELEKQFTAGGWKDPRWWAVNLAHGLGAGAPSLALGAAGGVGGGALGTAMAGPGGTAPGAVLGGATGFALGSVLQTLAPAYQRARQAGLDHDAAVDLALKETGIEGATSFVAGLAPAVSIFGRDAMGVMKRPISEALAQIFGVQPAVGLTGQAAQTGVTQGRLPTADELAQSYAEQALTGGAMVAGQHALGARSALAGLKPREAGTYGAPGPTEAEGEMPFDRPQPAPPGTPQLSGPAAPAAPAAPNRADTGTHGTRTEAPEPGSAAEAEEWLRTNHPEMLPEQPTEHAPPAGETAPATAPATEPNRAEPVARAPLGLPAPAPPRVRGRQPSPPGEPIALSGPVDTPAAQQAAAQIARDTSAQGREPTPFDVIAAARTSGLPPQVIATALSNVEAEHGPAPQQGERPAAPAEPVPASAAEPGGSVEPAGARPAAGAEPAAISPTEEAGQPAKWKPAATGVTIGDYTFRVRRDGGDGGGGVAPGHLYVEVPADLRAGAGSDVIAQGADRPALEAQLRQHIAAGNVEWAKPATAPVAAPAPAGEAPAAPTAGPGGGGAPAAAGAEPAGTVTPTAGPKQIFAGEFSPGMLVDTALSRLRSRRAAGGYEIPPATLAGWLNISEARAHDLIEASKQPAPPPANEAPFQKGERVVLPPDDSHPYPRHGIVTEANGLTFRPVMGGKPSSTTWTYTVKTDAGHETHASRDMQRETGAAPKVAADPVWNGHPIEPGTLQRTIDYAKRGEVAAIGKKARARVDKAKREHQREADAQRETATKAQAVLDAWKKANPERAAEVFGKPAEKPAAAPSAESPAAAPAVPPGAKTTGDLSIVKTKHAKHGHDLWVAVPGARVDRDTFVRMRDKAKELGGDYSSYRGHGAIPGFQFRTEDAANKFVAAHVEGGAQAAAPEAPKPAETAQPPAAAAPFDVGDQVVATPESGWPEGTSGTVTGVRMDPDDGQHVRVNGKWSNATDFVKAGEAAPAPAPSAEKWRQIGVNATDGHPLYEDDRGVRSYVENGIRSAENVAVRPGGGISTRDVRDKPLDYITPEEQAKWQPQTLPAKSRWPAPDFDDKLATIPPYTPDTVHEVAATWVEAKGQETGHEYLAVVDGDGKIIHAGTANQNDFIPFRLEDTRNETPMSLTFYHNHPRGSGASRDDVSMLASPGIGKVVGTIRDGFWIMAPRGDLFTNNNMTLDDKAQTAAIAFTRVEQDMKPETLRAIDRGDVTKEVATQHYNEMVARALAGRGTIDYVSTKELPAPLTDVLRKYLESYTDDHARIALATQRLRPDQGLAILRGQVGIDALPGRLERETGAPAGAPGTGPAPAQPPRPAEPVGGEHGVQGPAATGAEGAGPEAIPGTVQDEHAGPVLPRPVEPGQGGSRPTAGGRGAQQVGGRAGSEPAEPGGGSGQGHVPGLPRPEQGPAGAAGRPAEAGEPDRIVEAAEADAPTEGPAPEIIHDTDPAPDADVQGRDFSIKPGDVAEGRGPMIKARDNLRAIEISKQLAAEGRMATRAEQQAMVRYVGWGGLKGAFRGTDRLFSKGYEGIGLALEKALTQAEYRNASASTLNAHYTAEHIVRSMWDAVRRMGFEGGAVFEPGMGIGHFLGMMPDDLRPAVQYQGIEKDATTARIAKLLYPESGVRQADYSRIVIPDNTFDLAIGNPPFADIAITADPKYAKNRFLLHDYFFAKTMDSLRPGGIMGFVTSAGTMNKQDPTAREWIAQRAEFLGGVRLPSSAFKKNAGTEVTTDVLFFQKRPAPVDLAQIGRPAWVDTVERTLPNAEGGQQAGMVNQWFAQNPAMVLGDEGFWDKLYQGRYAVRPRDGQDLPAEFAQALQALPTDIMKPRSQAAEGTVAAAVADLESGQTKHGSYYLKGGVLMQHRDGAGYPVVARGKGAEGGMTAADLARVKMLVPIRDALRDVYRADLTENAADAAAARRRLNEHYDAFVKAHGPINLAEFQRRRPTIVQQESARLEAREEARSIGAEWDDGEFDVEPFLQRQASIPEIAKAREAARIKAEAEKREFDEGTFDPADMPDIVIEKRPNIKPFMDDPESYRLRAIERYDDATKQASKKEVFDRSVLTKEQEPELKSANDGVLWSLNQFGKLDLDRIAAKMGKQPADLIAELGDAVFVNPETGKHETADEYLSGDVVSKLETARAKEARDPALRRNVVALEAALPEPLAPERIRIVLGMPWIPGDLVSEFARTHMRIGPINARHEPAIGRWLVSTDNGRYGSRSADATGIEEWSTNAREAHELLSDALNRTPPVIKTGGGRDKAPVVDPVATQAAQDMVQKMKDEFYQWAMADVDRKDGLAKIYNDRLNRTVLRKVDGSYLTTPGIASTFKWRPHQQRAVARIIQTGNAYLAHAVGAGKTAEMIGAGMEMRRLGLVRKPMYVVPNHMLGQFTKEFYEQYPLAKISVADEQRFHTGVRKQFMANVAQDDLDAVIITHSSFGKLPISDEYQDALIDEQVEMLREALSNAKELGAERHTISRIEKAIQKLEQRLIGKKKKDQDSTQTFEEMGVDFLFIDEAHEFRKLAFGTAQGNMKGIDPEGSQKAWDLYTKIRYLNDQRPGRSVVLASGTPITNTMAELYSLSRYIQPHELAARSLAHFDSWAQTFGDTMTELEENAAGGYQNVTRFSRFMNTPELYKMVAANMDIVTSGELGELVVRPKLAGGKRIQHMAPRTDFLDRYQAWLASRMEAIKARDGKPEPGDDIMLSVINDGRHAAIDQRYVDKDAKPDPNSKLNMLVENVARIWKETKNVQFYDPATNYQTKSFRGPATQMVFMNFGVHGRGPTGFSGYKWLKQSLIRSGIPANEIAIIGDYKSALARQNLFNDMNAGKVRILIGHVKKMGTGVNAQKRLIAIHNEDPLWYPADDEQRNGRGIRQGNHNPEIQIHDYTTKGTYDSVMWQMMGRKARAIEQFFRGDPTLRDIEDLGEASMYEQASAMSTTDPRILELTDLRQQLQTAERRRDAFESEQYSMRNRIRYAESGIEHNRNSIESTKRLLAKRQDTKGDAFRMTVGKAEYAKRKDAGKALKDFFANGIKDWPKEYNFPLGQIGGFPLFGEFKRYTDNTYRMDLELSFGHQDNRTVKYDSEDPSNIIASAEAQLRSLDDRIPYSNGRIAELEQEIARLTPLVGRTFAGGAEIDKLRTAVRDLAEQIAPKEERPTAPAADDGETEGLGEAEPPRFGRRDAGFAENETPLYSGAERAAADLPQAKGTGEQMLALLSKQPGVKPEELEWMGVPEWLKGQKSVTRQALADYIRDNRVQVQEVVRGAPSAKPVEWVEKPLTRGDKGIRHWWRVKTADKLTAQVIEYDDGQVQAETANGYDRMFKSVDEAKAYIEQDFAVGTDLPTRYHDWRTKGGENYRELLLTLPPKPDVGVEPMAETLRSYGIYRPPNNVTLRDLDEAGVPQSVYDEFEARVFGEKSAGKALYHSSHWDEPNVLAHIRFADFRAPDGAKVLVVHEVQSDWHQAGRRQGYGKRPRTAADIERQYDLEHHEVHGDMVWSVRDRDTGGLAGRGATRDEAIQEALASEQDEANETARFATTVPNAPFKTTWPALAMRRVLKYAVDNGYDRVAWDTGDTAAKRFDLSQTVSRLVLHDNSSGGIGRASMEGPFTSGNLTGWDKQGQRVIDAKPVRSEEELVDLIGKEGAEKLLGAKPTQANYAGLNVRQRELAGDELRVGGKGMVGFYDDILPKTVGKIVGKYGAKVGRGEIIRPNAGDFVSSPWRIAASRRVWKAVEAARAAQEPGGIVDPLILLARHIETSETDPVEALRLLSPRSAKYFDDAGGLKHLPKRNDIPATPVHVVDITPRMRDAVQQEGLPLFRRDQTGAFAIQIPTEHMGDVTEAVNHALALTGNHARIEVYDKDHDTFTLVLPDGTKLKGFGYALGRLIRAAYEPGDDFLRGLRHEALHTLRNLGVITEKEWSTLEATAKAEGWRRKHNIVSRYGDLPIDQQIEEAIAEEFAAHADKPATPESFMGRLVGKVRAFLARLRNWMKKRGFQTADDVFNRMEAGEVGAREPDSGMRGRGPATVAESIRAADRFNETQRAKAAEAPQFGRVPEKGEGRDEWAELLRKGRRTAEEAKAMAARNEAVMFEDERGRNWLVSKEPSPATAGGDWRVTSFDKDGEATGHYVTRTAEEAFRDMIRRGYREVDSAPQFGRRPPKAADETTGAKPPSEWYQPGPTERALGAAGNAIARHAIAPIVRRLTPPLRTLVERPEIQRVVDGQAMRSAMQFAHDFGRSLAMIANPMSTGSDIAQVIAKNFANEDRRYAYNLSQIDKRLVDVYTPEERALMGRAQDEESEMRQVGDIDPDRGWGRLSNDQRAWNELLTRMDEGAWKAMKDVGIVHGEGLPAYMPRNFVMQLEHRVARVPTSQAGGVTGLNPEGHNIRTAGPMRRKHLEREETERGGKAKLGREAELVADIRAELPALQRAYRAVNGRILINAIRQLGKEAGTEMVADAWSENTPFTMADHPAFYTYSPRIARNEDGSVAIDDDGRVQLVRDEEGEPIIDRKPLYVARQFEGPLRAVMSKPPGAVYSALMQMKSLGVSLIMMSPMTHNMVIYGKAFPLMPGKMLTLQLYREGHLARTGVTYSQAAGDWWKARRGQPRGARVSQPLAPQIMNELIGAGMVPVNGGWLADILGIAQDAGGPPGKSLISKGAGALAGAFKGDEAKWRTRRAIDAAGQFWHGTLLWDRIADLQVGIATTLRKEMMDAGVPRRVANIIAAHFANRFAGVLPNESTSNILRRIENIVLFSRQFTLGNAAIMKDVGTGVPGDIAAQIEAAFGPKVGAEARQASKKYARRMAFSAFMTDMALFFGMNAALQTFIQAIAQWLHDDSDSVLDKAGHVVKAIVGGYVRRIGAAIQRRNEHPLDWLDPRNALTLPEEISPLFDNEPGRQDRIFISTDDKGRGIYVRNPFGKVGEEFKNWLTQPLVQLNNKLSTMVKPFQDMWAGKDYMGQSVFPAEGHGLTAMIENLGAGIRHYVAGQVPLAQVQGGYDLVTGAPGPGMSASKSILPFVTGITVSRGSPLGPQGAIMQETAKRLDQRFLKVWPDVVYAVSAGQNAAAVKMLMEIGEPYDSAFHTVMNLNSPQRRIAPDSYLGKKFRSAATPADMQRLQTVTH